MAPGSLVRSSTAIFRQVWGMAESRCSAEKGRYRWTLMRPTFSPTGGEVVHGLPGGLSGGAHENHHPLRVRRAVVVEEMVGAAGQLSDLRHVVLHRLRDGGELLVAGLPALEEDVRVHRGAPGWPGAPGSGSGHGTLSAPPYPPGGAGRRSPAPGSSGSRGKCGSRRRSEERASGSGWPPGGPPPPGPSLLEAKRKPTGRTRSTAPPSRRSGPRR